MRPDFPAASLLVSGLLFSAAPALADVTAQDVWDSWKTLAGTYDQTIAVENETYEGGVLTLSGITTSVPLPEGGEARGTLSDLVLTENGDGTVSIVMPPEYPFSFLAKGPEDQTMSMAMRFVQQGLKMTASGTGDAISYDFSAPSMGIVLDEMKENDKTIAMDLSATLADSAGTYLIGSGDPQKMNSTFKAGALDVKVAVDQPDENVKFDMAATMNDLASTSSGTMSPFAAGSASVSELLRAGLETQGQLSGGAATYRIEADDGETPFILSGTSDNSSVDFALTQEGIRYTGKNTGNTTKLELPSLPLPPLTMDVAEGSGEIRMPLIPSEDPKEFGIRMDLKQFSLGDSVWAMIDPSGGLPHDPANLTVDVSGLGRWIVDITDPEAFADAESVGEMPVEAQSVSINALILSALGARLTGSGGFDFDNATVPPAAEGQIDLQLVGANALIDSLIATGLMPEDQAMGARMMLGLFARPGSGDDTLVSTIEVKKDGSVLANGQRIR